MDYSIYWGYPICLFVGGFIVFFYFRKRILSELISFNSFEKGNQNHIYNKIASAFFARLSSGIDLSLYQNTTDAIELDRHRIAMDMHDEMAPYLSSLYIDLELVLREADLLSPEANKILLGMRAKTRQSVEALRTIIYAVYPSSLEHTDLTNAVMELCNKLDGIKGTKILFKSLGTPQLISEQHKLYLYRIIQELLNNCFKHSQAWHIFVTMTWTEDELLLKLRDTGIGLPKFINETNKFGISGIFARSAIIGAEAKLFSPKDGAEFELILPLRNKAK